MLFCCLEGEWRSCKATTFLVLAQALAGEATVTIADTFDASIITSRAKAAGGVLLSECLKGIGHVSSLAWCVCQGQGWAAMLEGGVEDARLKAMAAGRLRAVVCRSSQNHVSQTAFNPHFSPRRTSFALRLATLSSHASHLANFLLHALHAGLVPFSVPTPALTAAHPDTKVGSDSMNRIENRQLQSLEFAQSHHTHRVSALHHAVSPLCCCSSQPCMRSSPTPLTA